MVILDEPLDEFGNLFVHQLVSQQVNFGLVLISNGEGIFKYQPN